MRKKAGYREVCVYLTEQDYAALERLWRQHTTDRHVTKTAQSLLEHAIREAPAEWVASETGNRASEY